MAHFSSSSKERQDLYKIMIGSIVPRPIAFVSTRGNNGVDNLAPFSFFNGIGSHPPCVAFSCGDRGEEMKDTARNIKENPEFIVHIVSESIADQMNAACADYGADISEFDEAELTRLPGTTVNVSRVAESLVSMECRVLHHLRLGEKAPLCSHIVGEIQYFHIDDRLLNERGHVDPEVLQAIGRMGGLDYTRTKDLFTIKRPVLEPEDPRSIQSYKERQARKQAAEAAATPEAK